MDTPSPMLASSVVPNTSVQDAYLAKAVSTNEIMVVYLTNGVKLTGKILHADTFSFIMTISGSEAGPNSIGQLVFKSGTASILPHKDAKKIPQQNLVSRNY